MKENDFVLAGIEDKLEQCAERYMLTNTTFLDLRQISQAQAMLRRIKPQMKYLFWGGYSDAERKILMFLPDYFNIEKSTEENDADIFEEFSDENPLRMLRVKISQKARALGHRDYLGALMGLGIKREMVGDIVTGSDGADIIVLKEMTDFLLANFDKAGNTSFDSIEAVGFDCMKEHIHAAETINKTVASLRLDNVMSATFNVKRETVAQAVNSGMVFVNNLEVKKPDMKLEEGDVFVLRKKGKARLEKIGGMSRKDRIYITIAVY